MSSLEREYEHHLFAGMGFAIFVYDARGVGQSGGRRTHDENRLLSDAVAATEAAKVAIGGRASTAGLYGSSFAAKVSAVAKVDFAVIAAPLQVQTQVATQIRVPQLYVIPGADKEAPARPLVEKLRSLQKSPPPIDIAVYPSTQFDMIRSELRNGEPCQAGKAKSYYRLVANWIRSGRLEAQPDAMTFHR